MKRQRGEDFDEWLERNFGSEPQRRGVPEAEVVGVQFGLLSSEDIRRLSAVEVTQPVTQKVGVVQAGGVTEARLGTSNRAMLCSTCGGSQEECVVGHSGHIVLVQPVPNGEYLPILKKILECICVNCSRIKLPRDFAMADEITGIWSDKERLRRLYIWCRRRDVCESWDDTKRRRKIKQRCKKNGTTWEEEENQVEEVAPDLTNVSVEELLQRGQPCGARQPRWVKDDNIIVRPVWDLTEEEAEEFQRGTWQDPVFTPDDLLRVLSNISDQDIRLLGLSPEHSHPVRLLWKNFYVPTVNIRPSRTGRSGNNRCPNEDDLTMRIKTIQRFNLQLQAKLKKGGLVNLSKYRFRGREYESAAAAFAENPPPRSSATTATPSVWQCYDRLYRSVTSYQNAKLKGKGIAQYGKDKKSVRCRFKGGKNRNRVRGTVMGKRMDWSARTVITPNATMHIRDVEVPEWIAKVLTYPVRVNQYNRAELTSAVRRGPHQYPGARYVRRLDRTLVDLDSVDRHTLELTLGMVVERHLIEGDLVIMNRQPTLHKPSMMAHKVRINKDPSAMCWNIHLAVTPAYNADFGRSLCLGKAALTMLWQMAMR